MLCSRQNVIGWVTGTLLFGTVACFPANAATNEPSRWPQIMELNNLEVAGKTPFHLKIAFQLYDLEGKPSEEGTIEEWWASPGQYRLAISSPSLNVTVPGGPDADVGFTRSRFLIDQLLALEIRPAPKLPNVQFKEEEKSFDTMKMTCVVPESQTPSGGLTYCTMPSSNVLRMSFDGDRFTSATRNSIGDFHGTSVAMALEIAYLDKPAITGKVLVFQSFDPEKSSVALTKSEPGGNVTSGSLRLGGGVVAGKLLNRVAPTYPAAAKAAHIGGAVILHAVITKEGTIEHLEPIAARSTMLVGAAMDAVKQWTYQPYLLNGQPTEVDTTITVRFNLNAVVR